MVDQSQLLRAHLNTVDKTINYFIAEYTNPSEFKKIKELALQATSKTKNVILEEQIKSGYFSVHDFLIYLGANNQLGTDGINPQIVDLTLKLLADNFVVTPLASVVISPVIRYKATLLSSALKKLDLIHNIIFGFNFIAEKYRKSVFKIEPRNHDGDVSIGTGFLILKNNLAQHIVTNKHVVENQKSLKVKDIDDKEVKFGKITLHPSNDLALIELKSTIESPPFQLTVSFQVMNEIITMGYPSIPMTKFSYQVVHRGEVNSQVEDYDNNKRFLFSAKTSSGNSGSPIINNSGMVIGIVTEELFEETAFREKGKLPYYSAIPSIEINEFIR